MDNSKKGKFEFIDFKTVNGNEVPKTQSYLVNNMNKQTKNGYHHFNHSHLNNHQLINHQQNYNQLQVPQIRISPFNNIKQSMPFCYANYSMMNNHSNWLNSDEENSLKNKLQTDSMVSQMITVDCSSTTTQIASSTASSCSLPVIEANSDKLTPNDYESFKPNSPIKTINTKTNKLESSSLNLLNTIDNQNLLINNDKKVSTSLAPLTLEWTNLSCEISTRKNFISNIFNCFIANESKRNIYSNSESSSLNDLNRDSEASFYQLERMFRNRKKGRKQILDKQSGQFRNGTINAIIGASGAGKSTLLECISGRRRHGVEGSINIYANTEIFGKNITLAYLGQTESLINVLTVKETLLFASRLKNYRKIKKYDQHLKLVNSIISEFKLESCANNYIHNISGGQLKRVSIASEILSGPDIIILDEPTSGLDSCTAYTIIKLLRKITGLVDQQNFRAPIVIASIHQPSIQLLNEFHNLYVLSNNGKCIYQGEPQNMIKYLNKFNLKCPKYYDPVNFIIQIASGYYGNDVIHHLAEQERILQEQRTMDLQDNLFIKTNICSNPFKNFNQYSDTYYDIAGGATKLDQYVESKLYCNSKNNNKLSKFNEINQSSYFHQLPHIKTIKISNIIDQMKSQSFPFFYHTLLLTKRTYFGTIREPKLTWLRVFQALFIGFLMSFLYDHPIGKDGGCWSESMAVKEILNPSNPINENIKLMMNFTNNNNLSEPHYHQLTNGLDEYINQNKLNHQLNSKANTFDNVAFVFFVTLFLVMSSMMPTVLTFPSEVRIMQAERLNGYYSCSAYYSAKIIADTPFIIFNAILFCAIVYPLTGQLLEFKIFAMFTFVAIEAALIAHCIGMLFGTIYVHSVTSAVFMAPLSMSPVFLFSGFFGKISSLPLFLKPVAYASYVRYCFECFLISLYGFDRCKIKHNRTFFLHRYLHNMTLFHREKDLFFGKTTETTTIASNLQPNAEALIQNNAFGYASNLNLSNDLFKNFSTFVVDKNFFNKFQIDNFLKNNKTINLPELLSSTTESSNLIETNMINDNFSSTNISNIITNTISNVTNLLSTTTTNPIIDNNFESTFNNSINNSIDNSINNSITDNISTTNLNLNANAISSFSINPIDLLNENEINQSSFSNITNSLVLEFYNINDDIFWKNIIFLTVIFVFLRVLAYLILVIKTNRFK